MSIILPQIHMAFMQETEAGKEQRIKTRRWTNEQTQTMAAEQAYRF